MNIKRTLVFKYLDLTALVLCITIPVLKTINTYGLAQLGMVMYSYLIGGGYIILSCIINRLFLNKMYRSRIRVVCEIAFSFFLLCNFTAWLIKVCAKDPFARMDAFLIFLYIAYYGIPLFAILYIAVTMQEALKLKKAFKAANA